MRDGGPRITSPLPTCIAGFLAADECRDVIREIEAAHQQQAEIWIGDDFGVDPDNRMGGVAELPNETEILVQDRLWSVIADLEERYGCEISHVSGVTALIYRRGDHFAAHADGGLDDDAPSEVQRRRISLVVALNDGMIDFTGGELQFYPGLPPSADPRPDQIVSIRSRPGMLIAFASPMTHRVVPVIAGCRYSLALWALAPQ
jgi:Rps23 Pro-64 3,4-dihydroxylase Tpa1-like proline 4-hydroxylase